KFVHYKYQKGIDNKRLIVWVFDVFYTFVTILKI
ncbi:MAG: hypothetical protein RIR17_183, partial [Planctomycetota bacterium]